MNDVAYLVRYIQNGPDSEGFDQHKDYIVDIVFNDHKTARQWFREYVDKDSRFDDTTVYTDDGLRKEAHIIRCVTNTFDSPDGLHCVVDPYLSGTLME